MQRFNVMNILFRVSLLGVLVVIGCAGISSASGARYADGSKGRISGMTGEASSGPAPKDSCSDAVAACTETAELTITPAHLAGTWKLVSFHTRSPDGQKVYPFGKDARGRLIYEANGRMAVQLTNPGRPRFASEDPLLTSESEVRAAFDNYAAYYGTFSVNHGEQTITHHVEAALLPNWAGTDQKRDFEFDGTYLTLKGPLQFGGVRWVVSLVWERLP